MGPIGVLYQGVIEACLGNVAEFTHMLFELVCNVDALATHVGKPPKVVEAEVVDFNVAEFAAQNLRHAGFNLYWHIADVENASVWT